MQFSRRDFLSTAAAGVPAVALAGGAAPAPAAETRAPLHFHVLTSSEYDQAAMMKKLSVESDHKQVYESVSPLIIAPGIASLYLHMQNSMNAYQFSLGLGNLTTLGVLIGPSIVFALKDEMWAKYHISDALKGSNLAPTNEYYTASSKLDTSAAPDDPNGIYQDWSAQAVMARGGQFFVCHNATSGIAGMIASGQKMDPAMAISDFEKSFLPGFQLVPSGVAAVQQAQEMGWKIYPII